jgi:O-acetyl-ADP-ribose deacetylase (regulator of RNase III)
MGNLRVEQGDLTRFQGDAIVNAANETLLGGGGVDGAIHRAAGPELLRACRQLLEVRPGVRCPTGQARITQGFRLSARYVIHTVGPVWRGGNSGEHALLASCYEESLRLAEANQLARVAFPAISCGVYGFPKDEAARIADKAVRAFLKESEWVHEVTLFAFDTSMLAELRAAVEGD